MEKYLQEAFKAFDEIDTLNEDVFDISINDGLDKAKEFEDEPVWDDREEEIIIDPLAETEEDLQKDYIGKAILQCEICQSMIYKDPSEVVIDEESELANLEDICPFCQSQDGFKVIGEIKEFCDGEECEEDHKEEEPAEEPTEEKPEEEVEVNSEEEIEEPVEEAEEETAEDDELDEAIKTRKKVRIKEECEEELDEAKRPVRKSGLSNSEKVKRTLAKISESTERDKIDADADDKKEKAKAEEEKKNDDADADRDEKLEKDGLKEDFQKVDIETDTQKMSMESDESGKVTVTTEPKEEPVAEAGAEVIAPVSDEVKAEFKSSEEEVSEEPEEIDYDFDEFEEDDFDSLGEGFLKKVYENVKSFKTTEGRLSGNNLMLEGLITFKSGRQAKTNFVFEAYKATKTGKLKFIGENKQFAKGKKSFTLSGKADGKKLVCESLNYNYVAKAQDGSSKRLYGTIKK